MITNSTFINNHDSASNGGTIFNNPIYESGGLVSTDNVFSGNTPADIINW